MPGPRWYEWARNELGTHEKPGIGSDARVMAYRKLAKMSWLQGDDSAVAWCVSGRTLVTTPSGFARADEVEVGSLVLGPSGTPRTVLAAASRFAPTLRLRWHGGSMEITAEHPVKVLRDGADQWVPAGEVRKGDRVLVVRPAGGTFEVDGDLAYALGMYVADGHSTVGRKSVYINDAHDQRERVTKALTAAGVPFSVNERRTCVQFNIWASPFADMCRQFGRNSNEKQADQVLGWAPGARAAFLEGYCAGDGSVHGNRMACTTNSMRLAFGLAAIVRSLGLRASVRRYGHEPVAVIEGRIVNQAEEVWATEWHDPVPAGRFDQSRPDPLGEWLLVKANPEPTGDVEPVYDFTIEEEHAFIANGIVVHNCAVFVGAALEVHGIRGTRQALARSYATWGVPLKRPAIGCIVPLWRGSPKGTLGHIGFYAGQSKDGTRIRLLGGNQGDAVSYTWVAANRVLGWRWPTGEPLPTTGPVIITGAPGRAVAEV